MVKPVCDIMKAIRDVGRVTGIWYVVQQAFDEI